LSPRLRAPPLHERFSLWQTQSFLVDDHPLVREWLTNLINQQSDLTVCGEAETAPRALDAVAKTKPDVAIIDIRSRTLPVSN